MNESAKTARKRNRYAVLMAGLEKAYQQEYTQGLLAAAEQIDADLFFFVCQGFPETARIVDERSESRILQLPDPVEFDGIIALSNTIPDTQAAHQLLERLRISRQIPQVFMDAEGDYGTRISFDDASSLNSMITHLAEVHGCRTFALVTGPMGNPVADARANACWQGIHQAGGSTLLTFDGRWTAHGGQMAAQQLLKMGKLPDAVICGNDDTALALIDCLQQHGIRVPQDIRVTGFDARPDALARGLTTIRRPIQWAGELSVRRLHDERGCEGNILLPTQMILGTSCGCPACTGTRAESVSADDNHMVEQTLLRGVGFTSMMCSAASLEQAGETFVRFAQLCKAKDFHVVVDPDFFRTEDSGREGLNGREMLLLAGYHDGQEQICIPFNSRELLPGLANRAMASALAFLPLYYQDRSIGYIAADLERAGSIAMLPLQTLADCALTQLSQRMAIRGYVETLERLTVHDSLTGMYNRRGFYRQAQLMLSRAMEEDCCLALFSADMDGMKCINDTYGHMNGDEAICRMGRALADICGEDMICAHLSGDEFMAVGICSRPEDIEGLPSLLTTRLERMDLEEPWICPVLASSGVYAAKPMRADDLSEFVRLADHCMYENKRERKRRASQSLEGGN